jgi:pyridoxal 5'-phosphate synthase pdxT subunit
MKKIGILDIQGSVEEHLAALNKLDVEPVLVKTVEALKKVDALIMPGGESTTMGKLLRRFELRDVLIKRIEDGMPVWGTCAGAILLAKNIEGNQTADGLEVMDVTIERNSYGRQVESFETEIKFNGKNIPAVFIRAPRILKIGDGVEALSHEGEDIVAAREGNMFVTTFHPEMTEDLSVYEYFLDRCQSAF